MNCGEVQGQVLLPKSYSLGFRLFGNYEMCFRLFNEEWWKFTTMFPIRTTIRFVCVIILGGSVNILEALMKEVPSSCIVINTARYNRY